MKFVKYKQSHSENVRSEWEVDFDKDNFEYSYEINATTGEIIKNDKEID